MFTASEQYPGDQYNHLTQLLLNYVLESHLHHGVLIMPLYYDGKILLFNINILLNVRIWSGWEEKLLGAAAWFQSRVDYKCYCGCYCSTSKCKVCKRRISRTALTLQLVQQLGSWRRAFAFPLCFGSQVLGVAAHQVPSQYVITLSQLCYSNLLMQIATHMITVGPLKLLTT